eukprot:515920-Prymnesium_polylepis.1
MPHATCQYEAAHPTARSLSHTLPSSHTRTRTRTRGTCHLPVVDADEERHGEVGGALAPGGTLR